MKNYYLKTLLLFAALLSVGTINAQWQNGLWIGKQAYNWYFPIEAGLNFNTSPPTPLTDGQMYANPDPDADPNTEVAASMSDEEGNLLFYTNGLTVWNKNHEVMQNGMGLLGEGSGTQGALIIPKPGDANIYYIFTTGRFDYNTFTYGAFRYSEVNMTLENGLGAITSNKNISLLEPIALGLGNEEKLTAVYHADGQNLWAVTRQDNVYFSYLISSAGVSSTPVVSTAGVGTFGLNFSSGQMKFSPDGTKLAVVNPAFDVTDFPTEIFNFNNTTGEVTGPILSIGHNVVTYVNRDDYQGPDGYGVYGLEFSPNGRFLYMVTRLTNRVYQFDLSEDSPDSIISSATLLYEIFDFPLARLVQLQNGPDGKIYMSNSNGFTNVRNTMLHVIEYPNNPGLAAGFDANGLVDLAGKESGAGLPNFITSYFESGRVCNARCYFFYTSYSGYTKHCLGFW
jgi:hypothetical protein